MVEKMENQLKNSFGWKNFVPESFLSISPGSRNRHDAKPPTSYRDKSRLQFTTGFLRDSSWTNQSPKCGRNVTLFVCFFYDCLSTQSLEDMRLTRSGSRRLASQIRSWLFGRSLWSADLYIENLNWPVSVSNRREEKGKNVGGSSRVKSSLEILLRGSLREWNEGEKVLQLRTSRDSPAAAVARNAMAC